jgi:O-antigen/teichoic acid export membrane protein
VQALHEPFEGAVSPIESGSEGDRHPTVGRASIRRNVTHLLTSQVATWSIALVLTVVQPRLLGPVTQGRLRVAYSLWAIAAVAIGLGTSMFLQLEIARRGQAGLRLMGPVLALRTAVFAIAFPILVVGALVGGADHDLVRIFALYGLVTLLGSWIDVYTSAFVGLERMSAPALIAVVAKLLGTVAAVIVLFAGGGAMGLLLCVTGGNLIGLALVVRAFRRTVSAPLCLDLANWPMIARGGFAFMVAAAILTLYQQVDTVVISLLVDARTLGWYSASDSLFGTLLFLPSIVCTSIFPVLGRLHGSDDPEGFAALVRGAFAMLALVAVPIGLGTVVIGQSLAPLLFGRKFAQSGEVLAVLGVVLIITTATILFGTVALATGRQAFWNSVMFVGVLMTVPLDLVFVPWAEHRYHNGAIGGAMSYVVTEVMMFAIGLAKIVPTLVERATMWRVGRIVICGLAMVAATWPLRGYVIVAPIGVGVIVYVVAVLLTGVLSADERAMVGGVLARLGVRSVASPGGRSGS